jgi:hypothetical protein
MAVANTLAYYCMTTIMAVKSFTIQAPDADYILGWTLVAKQT